MVACLTGIVPAGDEAKANGCTPDRDRTQAKANGCVPDRDRARWRRAEGESPRAWARSGPRRL